LERKSYHKKKKNKLPKIKEKLSVWNSVSCDTFHNLIYFASRGKNNIKTTEEKKEEKKEVKIVVLFGLKN
jgi:hypothetical protein